MKILITGKNGFLAKELYNYFNKKYDLYFISPSSEYKIDLTNIEQVNKFFENHKYFDFVLHTSIKGGKRNDVDNFSVLSDNLSMFKNLLNNSNKYGYMFNFCSGAAFRGNKEIEAVNEEDLNKTFPSDYYGLSKNIISREIQKNNNIINFRLFGCFGKEEENTRFFKSMLNNIKNNNQPIIHQDKYMDYISAEDVCRVIEFYITNTNITNLPKDLNLVYNKKLKLTEMYQIIKSFTNTKIDCKIINKDIAAPYTGNGNKLNNLNIKLNGFEKSLMELKDYVIG